MTKKKDLKALVRERMAKTGENYTTALVKVQAQKAVPEKFCMMCDELCEPGATLSVCAACLVFDRVSPELCHACDKEPGAPGPEGWLCSACRAAGKTSDNKPREPGCLCHLEEGDSPCPVHGEEKRWAAAMAAEEDRTGTSLNVSGRGPSLDWFDGSKETLLCGHVVTRPTRGVLDDLLALHGLDASKEMRIAYNAERARHLSGECGVAKELLEAGAELLATGAAGPTTEITGALPLTREALEKAIATVREREFPPVTNPKNSFGAWLRLGEQRQRVSETGLIAMGWYELSEAAPALQRASPEQIREHLERLGGEPETRRKLNKAWALALNEFEATRYTALLKLGDAKKKEPCDTPYDECVLAKGHPDDHQTHDGTRWNIGKTMGPPPGWKDVGGGRYVMDVGDLPPEKAGEFVEGLKTKWNETVGATIDPATRERMEQLGMELVGPPRKEGDVLVQDARVKLPVAAPFIELKFEVPKLDPVAEADKAAGEDWLVGGADPSEALVRVRGFDQPVPKEMADAIEVLRRRSRDDNKVRDAVFENLFDAAPKEPELLWAGKGGNAGQAVFRTEFDKAVMESTKGMLPTEKDWSERKMAGPRPGSVLPRSEGDDYVPPEGVGYAGLDPDPSCLCGKALGTNKACPFHHPPVVQVDAERGDFVLPHKSEDVARKLLDRLIAARGTGESPASEADVTGDAAGAMGAASLMQTTLVKGADGKLHVEEPVCGKTEHAVMIDDANLFSPDPLLALHQKVHVTLDEVVRGPLRIVVNGKPFEVEDRLMSYRDVLILAGYDPERVLSVTYHARESDDRARGGILWPTKPPVEVSAGMVFNVADTSSA